MSTFTDYNTQFKGYNSKRIPVGASTIAAMIAYHCKPLQNVHMLDAGCGTGNYSRELLDRGVKQVTLLDASSGMLSAAKENLAIHIKSGHVKEVVEAKLPVLPFQNDTFDVVMFNCVLHHLDKSDANYTKFDKAISEARRVLKQGGLLVLTTQIRSNLENTWYYNFSKCVLEKYNSIFPPIDMLKKMFENAKLELLEQLGILGEKLLNEHDRLDGPLDEKWRHADSYWAIATERELEATLNYVKRMQQDGTLEDFKRQHDKVETGGLVTLLVGKSN